MLVNVRVFPEAVVAVAASDAVEEVVGVFEGVITGKVVFVLVGDTGVRVGEGVLVIVGLRVGVRVGVGTVVFVAVGADAPPVWITS